MENWIIIHHLYQDLHRKLTKCFDNYIPTNIIQDILNEGDLDNLIKEMVNHKDFEKSETAIETFASIEEIKYPQEDDAVFPIVINIDDLNEKQMNDPRVQAMFKRSRHHNISIFIIVKITTNYQRELLEPMELYIIHSNQTFQTWSLSLSIQSIYGYDTQRL